MAYSPDVILLDEPFSALDWFLKDRMQLELTEMLKDYEGMVIMVSHDRDEIYRFSEELLIVDEGKVVKRGETRSVLPIRERARQRRSPAARISAGRRGLMITT
jgi:molybdate transport system ATP-binding protein